MISIPNLYSMSYKTFTVEIQDKIAHVAMNRPDKANSLNRTAWEEMQAIFESLDENPEARVIVLSGNGKHFCAGIDVAMLAQVAPFGKDGCPARTREKVRKSVLELQAPITAIEKCSKPVLAAIHGGCIGGGVDIVTACDMRYCTDDAYFTVREIDMGMVADIGTLQRLPKVISQGIAREMVYTGRKVYGPEALGFHLVNKTFPDKDALIEGVMAIAANIARKSPLSIRGAKHVLNYSRDHGVDDGLEYIATWNAGMLISDDIMKAVQAYMQKSEAVFED